MVESETPALDSEMTSLILMAAIGVAGTCTVVYRVTHPAQISVRARTDSLMVFIAIVYIVCVI